jgi:O-methyltransferase domain
VSSAPAKQNSLPVLDNPTVRGVLFDRMFVIDSARIVHDPSWHDRISLIAGDFFVSIPPHGDIYVIKQVLHDWDDARASAILNNCRRVMKTGAKLLIVEMVVPDAGPAALTGSVMDLQMVVMHGGRDTRDEFVKLLGTQDMICGV